MAPHAMVNWLPFWKIILLQQKKLGVYGKKLGLTQKEFSELTGCSKATVERWEREEGTVKGPISLLVRIKNYTENIMFQAFGGNLNPDFAAYQEFLKSRCFPETRDKIKLVLKDLDIPFYDPYLIIQKTEGRMAEDDFWILIEK